ncbi:uncharacterized protein LOC127028523 isoform X2 [Gymnogyps californianus]|uniref:uncharacterized protein LOC127028523 isoform X2 n=1 Tax=Gymnogyps californianus TaxID=33616 RepID=UPI0021C58B08|nr:uncharacterized protein LOC127028523 isoform X2 [Gymnogyps californianus]
MKGSCQLLPPAADERQPASLDDGIGGAYRASRLDPGYKPWGHPRVHVDQDARWIPVPEPGGHPRAVPVGSGCLSSRLERVREPQGDPTDVAAGDGYPASWLGSRADPQGGRIDVARGRAFPAFPAPRLDPGLDPSRHPKETNRETVQKEAFQKGSSHRVPVSDEEREAMQETGTPGADAGKKAEAAGREELRKYYIPVTASALGVLLLGIVVSCVVIARLRKRDPRTQRDQEALGQADTDSAWKSEDQTRDKGKAESGEGTRKGEVAQANEIFSNGSSPSPWPFAAELAQLYRNVSADPSPLPACPSCSLTDSVSSLDTWISLDSPQPNPFWCPCYQYQQGYCTSEDESF